MVQIADVNKLKCKFVREWAKYLHNRKYDTAYCFEKTYEYFKDFKLATTLIDCLEYEDECALSYDASLLPNEPDNNSVSINCAEQAVITTTVTSESCAYTPSASIDGQAKMKYNFINNSVLQNRTTNLYVSSTCNSTPVFDETYTDNITYYTTGYTITGARNMVGGYLTFFTVYKTDTNGDLIDSAIFLNTSTTTTYLSGSYGTVLAHDLLFASSNYVTALTTVIKNAIASFYGSHTIIDLDISFDSSGNLFIFTKAKHNPSGEWVGINTDNGKHSISHYDGMHTISNVNTI